MCLKVRRRHKLRSSVLRLQGAAVSGNPGASPKVSTVMEQRSVSFQELGLSSSSLAAIEKMGFQKPSPIQAALIPVALTGKDCIGQAQTGTGKTAAFVLPVLERIHLDD